jgi:hypothetical protein
LRGITSKGGKSNQPASKKQSKATPEKEIETVKNKKIDSEQKYLGKPANTTKLNQRN